jgi:hypothetical protein
MEVAETEEIISTIALAVTGTYGADRKKMAEVLRAKGATGVDGAAKATSNLPVAELRKAVKGRKVKEVRKQIAL